jgi:hypothetical protein
MAAGSDRARDVSTLELILRMLSYVATPIIAVAAVRIAWEQTKVNRQKLVLDRYDHHTACPLDSKSDSLERFVGSASPRSPAEGQIAS